MRAGLYILFIIFSFFPYLRLLPVNVDSQPIAVLIGFMLLPKFVQKKNPKSLEYLFYIMLFSIMLLIPSGINFSNTRYLFNYISLFIIPFTTYHILTESQGLNFQVYKWVVLIWFFVGFLQLTVMPDFASSLVFRGDSEELVKTGRGVLSLAPEPTFYGIVCILFAIIGALNFREKRKINLYLLLLLIQLILFSRSSTCFFILILSIFLYLLYKVLKMKRNKFFVLFSILVLFIFIYFLFPHIANYLDNKGFRLGRLLTLFFKNPQLMIIADESANHRFNSIVFSIKGFIDNFGIPRGYGTFPEYIDGFATNHPLSIYLINFKGDRIMSGIGILLFELGILGFIPIWIIIKSFRKVSREYLPTILMMFSYLLILLNAINFSNALISFLLGNIIYLAKKQGNNQYLTKTQDS